MGQQVLIFGFGYTAKALVQQCSLDMIATSRHAEAYHEPGVRVIDFTTQALAPELPHITHVLITVPPDELGDPVLSHFCALLAQYAGHLRWIGYVSSTGVYGDHQGAWVDEQSACLTPGRQGQQRLVAEQAWSAFCQRYAIPLTIFRVAGIYGPGRNPLVRLLAGETTSIDKPGQVFSRIHVDDLVQSILQAMQHPELAGVYNIADDEPASILEVNAFAAQLLGLPAPTVVAYASAALSPRLRAFYQANRRVSNAKLKRELGVQLTYPDYRVGLESLLC
jgi:nucleoside-diphosphate-sugar epimerase